MPPMKDATTVKAHVVWRSSIVHARKTGNLAPLAQILLGGPPNLCPEDLQLLGKLFKQTKLIAKKRGPKSRPIAVRLGRAAAYYSGLTKRTTEIKKLSPADRAAAIAADAFLVYASFMCRPEQVDLFDRATRINAAADFGKVTVRQLEDHLKRGPRPPAKR
jgi:hypothetical protein